MKLKGKEKQIYNLSKREAFLRLSSTPSGLSFQEASKRIAKIGPNIIQRKKNLKILRLIFSQFNDALVYILLSAGFLALFFGAYRDAYIIFIIIFINASIGFFQEFRAERILDQVEKLTSDRALVSRSGKKIEIDSSQIVPGDIVHVSAGDIVPADGLIIEAYNLRTNNFIFTGESKPVNKYAGIISKKNIQFSDIKNMLFMGESVLTGGADILVTATGMATELGRIADITQSVKEDPTPLQNKLRILGKHITVLALVIGGIVLLIEKYNGTSFYNSLLFAIAIAVSVVPEGLPASLSISLSLGMRRLLKVKVLTKKLIAVETLGSVNLICTDKTGTITRNELTVKKIYFKGKIINVGGEGFDPRGDFFINNQKIDPKQVKDFDLLFKTGVLCNNALLIKKNEKWQVLGDPTEGAIITAAKKYHSNEKDFLRGEKKRFEIAFTSERMRMSVIYQNDELYSYVKGSPEIILQRSNYLLTEKGIKPLSDDDRKKIFQSYNEFSNDALRVLAFAFKKINSSQESNFPATAEEDLVFIGMMAMIDPPRLGVKEAIAECLRSGIAVLMITGDYELTAKAIAREIGLISESDKNPVINGAALVEISNDQLQEYIQRGTKVFARITPEQKLRIASVLKRSGYTIAMTGDVVNDAPALKKADIGVAMGIMGTDVSKEAADMILLNDNFSSIVAGIKEGRTIFQNIKKFVHYVFTSNMSEFLTVIFGVAMGIPSPITAIQILAIDLGTDVLPSLALGVEPSESDVMDNKPISKDEPILGKKEFFRIFYLGLMMCISAIFAFLWSLKRGGWSFGQDLAPNSLLYMKSTTATYTVLAMTQFANLFASRSATKSIFSIGFFRNKYIFIGLAGSLGLLYLFMNVNFFSSRLGMSPIDNLDWVAAFSATIIIFLTEETRKLICRKKFNATNNSKN